MFTYTICLPVKFNIAAAWCVLILCNLLSSLRKPQCFPPPIFLPFSIAVQRAAGVGCVLFEISNRSAFFFYQSWILSVLIQCTSEGLLRQGWWRSIFPPWSTKHICRRDAQVSGFPWAFPLQIWSFVCLFIYLILQKQNKGALSSRSWMLYRCCRCLHCTTIYMLNAWHGGTNKKVSFNFIDWFILMCHALTTGIE